MPIRSRNGKLCRGSGYNMLGRGLSATTPKSTGEVDNVDKLVANIKNRLKLTEQKKLSGTGRSKTRKYIKF